MRGLAFAFSFLVVAVIAALVVGVIALVKVSDLASQGARAAATQRQLYPITCRVYHRLEAHGILTHAELERYVQVGPVPCER